MTGRPWFTVCVDIHLQVTEVSHMKDRHLLCGDPSSFSQRLLTVDVDGVEADEPETHDTLTQRAGKTSNLTQSAQLMTIIHHRIIARFLSSIIHPTAAVINQRLHQENKCLFVINSLVSLLRLNISSGFVEFIANICSMGCIYAVLCKSPEPSLISLYSALKM